MATAYKDIDSPQGHHSGKWKYQQKATWAIKNERDNGVPFSVGLRLGKGITVRRLRTGFPGNVAVSAETPGGKIYVFKTNENDPKIAARDARRHTHLRTVPEIGRHVSKIWFFNEGEGVYGLNFVAGDILKEQEVEAKSQEEVKSSLAVFTTVLETLRRSLKKQEKQDGSKVGLTLQREQWPDTQEKVKTIAEVLSLRNGFSENAFWENALNIDGVLAPTLQTIVHYADIYFRSNPESVFDLHGDLHGGNIVITDSNKPEDFGLIDGGNAVPTPPEEEISKLIKKRTASVMSSCNVGKSKFTPSGILLNVNAEFSEGVEELHKEGQKYIGRFAEAINDKDLPEKIELALSFSYLREMVYNFERPEMTWEEALKRSTWALEQTVRHFMKAQSYVERTFHTPSHNIPLISSETRNRIFQKYDLVSPKATEIHRRDGIARDISLKFVYSTLKEVSEPLSKAVKSAMGILTPEIIEVDGINGKTIRRSKNYFMEDHYLMTFAEVMDAVDQGDLLIRLSKLSEEDFLIFTKIANGLKNFPRTLGEPQSKIDEQVNTYSLLYPADSYLRECIARTRDISETISVAKGGALAYLSLDYLWPKLYPEMYETSTDQQSQRADSKRDSLEVLYEKSKRHIHRKDLKK